jgi:hypothetical protein
MPGEVAAQGIPELTLDRVASIPREELDAITSRGRLIAGYDFAAWHASDAIRALQPREELVRAYIARPKPGGIWEVAFGRLNTRADTFRIAFRAIQREARSTLFTTYEMRPPSPDVDYFLRAARAVELCITDFGRQPRPYNVIVIPAGDVEDWYVYLVPAPTVIGVWPHGGDLRYRVRTDGRRIVERRRMHNTVLEYPPPPERDGAKLVSSWHTALLDDRPEDTDVFHVLTREPRLTEIVMSRSFAFVIDTTGRIAAYVHDTTVKRVTR